MRNIRTGAEQKSGTQQALLPPPPQEHANPSALLLEHRAASRKVTKAQLQRALKSANRQMKFVVSTRDSALRRKKMAERRAAAAADAVNVARQDAREAKAQSTHLALQLADTEKALLLERDLRDEDNRCWEAALASYKQECETFLRAEIAATKVTLLCHS